MELSGFNDNHREKLCFTSFSILMAASDLFHIFPESVKFFTLHSHVLKSIDV